MVELLVVLVIIGVLVSLALPRYEKVVTRSKKMEAKILLEHLYELESGYYLEFDRYSFDYDEIGFDPPKLISEGGKARYRVSILEADTLQFVAQAKATIDFDKDGVYNLWAIDQTGTLIQKVED